MPQRTMKRLVTAIFAAGLVAGMALNSPSAWADPEVNPDPAAIDAPPVEQPLLPPPPEEVPPPPAPFVPHWTKLCMGGGVCRSAR